MASIVSGVVRRPAWGSASGKGSAWPPSSGVAVTMGVGLGSGAESGPTLAANAPRPMLAVSTTAVPPAASLYSGSRAKVLPEKYRMGFFLLNIPVPHS